MNGWWLTAAGLGIVASVGASVLTLVLLVACAPNSSVAQEVMLKRMAVVTLIGLGVGVGGAVTAWTLGAWRGERWAEWGPVAAAGLSVAPVLVCVGVVWRLWRVG